MTSRKPLPYSAGGLIDDAIMANTMAGRKLYQISQGKLDDPLTTLRDIVQAMEYIRQSTDALKQVKVTARPDGTEP